jgi:hypothetical protein
MAGHAAAIIAFLVVLPVVGVRAGEPTREPENDNREYLLDLVTNAWDRTWREAWDEGDNRFRFRLGSNNVRQWFLEEELKFATELSNRLRFRFHHGRLLRTSTESLSHDTFELEFHVKGTSYLSFFVRPTFHKSENAVGLLLQKRQAVDEFAILFVEFPHVLRNFAERRSDSPDSLIDVFTRQPVRLGVDLRQRMGSRVWVRLAAEFVPDFEMAVEDQRTLEEIPVEDGRALSLEGWAEYVPPIPETADRSDRAVGAAAGRTAVGVAYGYRWLDKDRESQTYLLFGAPNVSPETGFRYSSRAPSGWVAIALDRDFFSPTSDANVLGWTHERGHVEPYGWLPLGHRLTLRGSVRIERRDDDRRRLSGGDVKIRNEYLVPRLGLRWAPREDPKSLLEGGLAAEYRWRDEATRSYGVPLAAPFSNAPLASGTTKRWDDFSDHRLYLAYEHRFGPARLLRVVESIDLDSEDWGQFWIHDHFFLQLSFDF